MEADISKARAGAEKAAAEGDAEKLRPWRKAELQLRDEKHQLRDEKARIKVQQQGITPCLPLRYRSYILDRGLNIRTFRPGSIIMSTSP